MTMPPPSPAPRSSFVTVMAWLSLAMALMSAACSALQAAMALALPGLTDFSALLPPGTPVPASLAWLGAHLVALSVLGAIASLGVAWISWALLQRREWARVAFIALLALVALANFAAIPLADALVEMALGTLTLAPASGAEATAQLLDAGAPMLAAVRLMAWISALTIAAVHAGIIWQLCRPGIRAEFTR
ncbi:hypothetical protein P6166_08300 [Stenotrophomonas sp. HITSZ_GD]|uniref:hypothetical protein n=1 Tax=Stenotrophomonas sp. HITSZ_GD TaxID=3037248 RepID=UPI00240E2863|nr:hypothetical protein [Stenotrophomonas sp. HITSZ_GD]MDG2525352.1 hypothetical protein [Stenotrophomonas sp. HITSZ_GD]